MANLPQDHVGTAFKRFDEVRIIAFDASWVAHCVVAHASLTEVILTKPRITTLPEQRENLYQDDRYFVKFVGNGYAVVRKVDGQKMMAGAFPSAAVAEKALLGLYPKRVS